MRSPPIQIVIILLYSFLPVQRVRTVQGTALHSGHCFRVLDEEGRGSLVGQKTAIMDECRSLRVHTLKRFLFGYSYLICHVLLFSRAKDPWPCIEYCRECLSERPLRGLTYHCTPDCPVLIIRSTSSFGCLSLKSIPDLVMWLWSVLSS